MFIVLPFARDGLNDVTRFLSAANIRFDMSELKPRMVDLFIPRFQVSAGFPLKEALEAMGMRDAFSGEWQLICLLSFQHWTLYTFSVFVNSQHINHFRHFRTYPYTVSLLPPGC